MKTLEYFFYGKPVVSTPIEELKQFPKFVRIGKTTVEWERNIRELLSKPWPINFQKEERKIAKVNSWDKKLSEITRLIH
jgi:hypothetical protein